MNNNYEFVVLTNLVLISDLCKKFYPLFIEVFLIFHAKYLLIYLINFLNFRVFKKNFEPKFRFFDFLSNFLFGTNFLGFLSTFLVSAHIFDMCANFRFFSLLPNFLFLTILILRNFFSEVDDITASIDMNDVVQTKSDNAVKRTLSGTWHKPSEEASLLQTNNNSNKISNDPKRTVSTQTLEGHVSIFKIEILSRKFYQFHPIFQTLLFEKFKLEIAIGRGSFLKRKLKISAESLGLFNPYLHSVTKFFSCLFFGHIYSSFSVQTFQ